MRHRYDESPGRAREETLRQVRRLTWRTTQLGALATVGFAIVFARTAPAPAANVQPAPATLSVTPAGPASPTVAATRATVKPRAKASTRPAAPAAASAGQAAVPRTSQAGGAAAPQTSQAGAAATTPPAQQAPVPAPTTSPSLAPPTTAPAAAPSSAPAPTVTSTSHGGG